MKEKYYTMPNSIFGKGITPSEFAVLSYLRMRADRDTGNCFPKINTIASDCNISPSTVKRCINSLEKKGLIRRTAIFKTNSVGKQFRSSNYYHIFF